MYDWTNCSELHNHGVAYFIFGTEIQCVYHDLNDKQVFDYSLR